MANRKGLSSPPKAESKVRGKASKKITETQEKQYQDYVAKIKEKIDTEGPYILRLRHATGKHAANLLGDPKTYGPRKIDALARDFDCKRLTLTQSIKFSKCISKEMLEELCLLKPAPTWRMMARWAGIPDDVDTPGKSNKRDDVLKDILAGNIKSSGFDDHLRKVLDRGPKKPRRPQSAVGTFRKIEAEAATMSQHLDLAWFEKASKELESMEDTTERRTTITTIKDSAKQLKTLRAQIDKALQFCDKLQ